MPVLRSLALALVVAVASPARGAEPPIPLQYNLALDASITAAMGLSVILLSDLPARAPAGELPLVHAAGHRRRLPETRWSGRTRERTADVLSTVIDAVIPASAATYLLLSANAGGDVNAGLVDTLLVTEAAAAALLVNQVVKLLVGRQRPYVFFENDLGYAKSEDNLSFYGGHTSFAFSVAAATVTVAAMRGYAGVGIVAGVGFTLSAARRLPPHRRRPALPDRHPHRRRRGRPHGLGHPPDLPLPQPGSCDRAPRCARPPSPSASPSEPRGAPPPHRRDARPARVPPRGRRRRGGRLARRLRRGGAARGSRGARQGRSARCDARWRPRCDAIRSSSPSAPPGRTPAGGEPRSSPCVNPAARPARAPQGRILRRKGTTSPIVAP